MSPLSSPGHERLFRPWESRLPSGHSPDRPDAFIELPSVSSYEQLLDASDFPDIQAQFLNDLGELRVVVRRYVNDQYDQALGLFHDNLAEPNRATADSLLPLYRDTRYRIHQLVQQLRDYQPAGDVHDAIASLLHECLNGVHLCPAGVHSRFANVLDNLSSVCSENIDGELFKARRDLYRTFIQSFMLNLQCEGIDLGQELEVHWFNGLYNVCCESLALPPIVDPLANAYLNDKELSRYLTNVRLSVNACTILRKIVGDWSERLLATLASVGCSHWLTGTRSDDNTATGIDALDARVFNPINCQMGTACANPLNLAALMECSTDDSFHLGRHREKLCAWIATHFFGSDTRVFAPFYSGFGTHAGIATINQLYFWVVCSDQPQRKGQALAFVPDQSQPVQLRHLQSIDFGTWSDATALALLTQALEQTVGVNEVATFFLDSQVIRQIDRLPKLVMQTLSTVLREKLIYASKDWQQSLCEQVCEQFAGSTAVVPSKALDWLSNTPLLPRVLTRLHRFGRDISRLTAQLDTRQIAEFSPESMAELLTETDCQRLFVQAFRSRQVQTVSDLLLTGHCDELILRCGWEKPRKSIRMFRRDDFAGVHYLLTRTDINCKDTRGLTPLFRAIANGHSFVARVLLNVPGIEVNIHSTDGSTPLHRAARSGYQDVVSTLVGMSDTNVNSVDNEDITPLHWAVYADHHLIVRTLLRAPGILVNAKKNDGMTPLIVAAHGARVRSMKALLPVPDIDVNAITHTGWTALCIVAKFGYVECLRELLKTTSTRVNLPTLESGCTPLHCAVGKNQKECVRVLLEVLDVDVNKADVDGMAPVHTAALHGFNVCLQALLNRPDIAINQHAGDGATALHLAAGRGELHCLRLLLAHHEINVNVRCNNGWTPLSLAIMGGYSRCVSELLAMPGINVNDKIGGWSPLNHAAERGLFTIVKSLLAVTGIDVNASNDDGMTPLHCAVRSGHLECAGAILAAPDIDVNAMSRSGNTPLNTAIRNGHFECVKLLLQNTDIDVNLASHGGLTPLFSAVEQDQPDCLRALLNVPDVAANTRTNKGITALELAAEYGRLPCLEALLATGADQVNRSGRYGALPPLHRVAGNGFVACVKLLLGVPGIDINKQCDKGYTPLHLAARKNQPECVRELLAVEGIKVNLPCRRGITPLASADTRGHSECGELIAKKQNILSTFRKSALLEKRSDSS